MSYDTLASKASIDRTIAALHAANIKAEVIPTRGEALERVKALIPHGASIMNGASETLREIGLIDYLKEGNHGWNNLHEGILAEKDPAKQSLLRRQATLADYYLGSVHAATEAGELLIASNSGAQLPEIAYDSPNVILIAGTQKIVPDLSAAWERLKEHVVPLEDARMMRTANVHTKLNKALILFGEARRDIRVIFIEERLGF